MESLFGLKLLGMGEGGAVALARVEMEILLKVVSDFMEQLSALLSLQALQLSLRQG